MEQVETVNINAEQQGVDSSAGAEDINIAELVEAASSEQTTVEPIVADAQESDLSADDSDVQIKDQSSFNIALAKRLERERKKYEQSPEYQMGKAVIAERMARDNVTAEAAYKSLQQDSIKAKARDFTKNPEQFFTEYLNKQNEPVRTEETSSASYMAKELIAARDAGLIPQDFAPKSDITPEFVQNMQRYGTEAALKMWEIGKDAAKAAEVTKRKNSAQPMNVGGASVSAPSVDFSSMSTKEFAEFDRKVREAAMRGKRVQF